MMTPAVAARARNRSRKARTRPVAVGYCRVSTKEQAENGASMAAQAVDLAIEAERRGWDLELVEEPARSGRTMDKRPKLGAALELLRTGQADVLLVTALDRLSRDSHDYLGLVKDATREGWQFVAIRDGIDTARVGGQVIDGIKAVLAQEESRKISERVTRGMAQKKAEGGHMGRTSAMSAELAGRVRELAADGKGARLTAQALTAEGWPTPTGSAVWSDGAARSALRSVALADQRAAILAAMA
jgi:DNA invertase Pin-like site-specific DNA recombinase